MNVVVAVSGGVDSVVLLDMLATSYLDCSGKLIVAHFDHGIRADSAADARFVAELAARYGVDFVGRREELGADVSEHVARRWRYAFLHEVAEQYKGQLVTAHHQDDLVETIALNIRRGTRWRGLACMSDERIWRPLLKRTKSELITYAMERRLEWCEDETNMTNEYQRNCVRKKLTALPFADAQRLYQLWQRQQEIKGEIKREIDHCHFPVLDRYFLIMIDRASAQELVYDYIWRKCGVSLLGIQLERLLLAVKAGRPGTRWEIGQGVVVMLSRRNWRAEKRK